MNILITGAHGFLGKHFKEYFSKKYTVYATGREDLNVTSPRKVSFL